MPWCMLGINPTSSSFEFLQPKISPKLIKLLDLKSPQNSLPGNSFSIGTLSEQVFKYLGFSSHYKPTYFRPVVPGMFSSSMFHGNLTVQPQCQPPGRKETWFMDYNGIMVVRDPPIRPYSISCFSFLTTYYINGMILQVWVYMVYIPIIRIQVVAWSSKWAP